MRSILIARTSHFLDKLFQQTRRVIAKENKIQSDLLFFV
jgi:hypothetical protein